MTPICLIPPPKDFLVVLAILINYLEPNKIDPKGQQRFLFKLIDMVSYVSHKSAGLHL
jgi:hypothetical protein